MRETCTRRQFIHFSAAAVATAPAMRLWAFAVEGRPRVGCQANGFVTRTGDFAQLLPALKKIHSLGYAGFECNNHLVTGEFGRAAETRRRFADAGLEFIGMHTSLDEADKGDFAALARGGAALGCHNIVMSGEGLSATGQFGADALQAKAQRLERLGGVCRDNGMTLAYHNHTQEFANHNAEMQAIADHTDPKLVSFLMDAGHGYQGGGDPAEFLRRNPQRLVGCHLKTFKNNSVQVALGQGDFGFEPLAAAIRSTGWSGWIIDEEGGTAQGAFPEAVGPDRAYIRKVFGV